MWAHTLAKRTCPVKYMMCPLMVDLPASTWPQKTMLRCFLSALVVVGAASSLLFCLHTHTSDVRQRERVCVGGG